MHPETSLPVSAASLYPLLNAKSEVSEQSGYATVSHQITRRITPVPEGTAAESPDMNSSPDAAGGSVSSF